MPKISIVYAPYTETESRGFLMQVAEGIMETFGKLDTVGRTEILSHIEVIRVKLTTWVPHGHLWVEMILNNEGKKETFSFTKDPSKVEIGKHVECWILETLNSYLAKLSSDLLATARNLETKMNGLKPIIQAKAIERFAQLLEEAGYENAMKLITSELLPTAKNSHISLYQAAKQYCNQDEEQDTSWHQLFRAMSVDMPDAAKKEILELDIHQPL
ncbi:MAG: hypothetical protein WCO12_02095 [bacterium]